MGQNGIGWVGYGTVRTYDTYVGWDGMGWDVIGEKRIG